MKSLCLVGRSAASSHEAQRNRARSKSPGKLPRLALAMLVLATLAEAGAWVAALVAR